MNEINLLTTEEKLEQKIQFFTKISNIFLTIILFIFAGVGYYFNTLTQPLIKEKTNLDAAISTLKSQLTDYSNEELSLLEIKTKYDVAKKFYDQKISYELLIRDIYERNISGGVTIKTISIDTDKDLVSIRVTADSTYFKRFVDNLKTSQASESNIKDLFSNSGIPEDVNEVSKEYVVTVKFNKGALSAK